MYTVLMFIIMKLSRTLLKQYRCDMCVPVRTQKIFSLFVLAFQLRGEGGRIVIYRTPGVSKHVKISKYSSQNKSNQRATEMLLQKEILLSSIRLLKLCPRTLFSYAIQIS